MTEFADRLDRAHARLRDESDAELINAKAAGEMLNVPKTWVLAEARAGRIPHVRLGRYVRFEPEELRVWWRNHRQGPRARAS